MFLVQFQQNNQQFSPIIAHNYKETSYPTGVFEYEIKNLPKDSKNQPDQEKEVQFFFFPFQNNCIF